jgi:hypothetical protein
MEGKRKRGHRRRKKTKKIIPFSTVNVHHLTPRSRQGNNEESNLLILKAERHYYWHQLFRKANGRERTLEEVITLLLRVHRLKGRCTGAVGICLLEMGRADRR